MHEIAALILAAGRAARFRADSPLRTKLVAHWRGEALVHHVAMAALASAARPVIVVTGHARGEVEAVLAGAPLRLVHNADFANGMAGSLQAGIGAVPETCAGVLVLLGDMPKVKSATLDAMIAAFTAAPDGTRALVPMHQGQAGNPVLLGRALFATLGSLTGDQGARRLIEAQDADVIRWPCEDPGILADVDTGEALARLDD